MTCKKASSIVSFLAGGGSKGSPSSLGKKLSFLRKKFYHCQRKVTRQAARFNCYGNFSIYNYSGTGVTTMLSNLKREALYHRRNQIEILKCCLRSYIHNLGQANLINCFSSPPASLFAPSTSNFFFAVINHMHMHILMLRRLAIILLHSKCHLCLRNGGKT